MVVRHGVSLSHAESESLNPSLSSNQAVLGEPWVLFASEGDVKVLPLPSQNENVVFLLIITA